MQDPATFQAVKPHFPELEQLQCPRCESTNTKFCYYNNYNLSQPRHFCKNCRRYWTKGGALRNIPVGGGTRKNAAAKKRQKPDPNPTRKAHEAPPHPLAPVGSSNSTLQEAVSGGSDHDPGRLYGLGVDPDHKMLDITGSFSSLLATNGGFGSVLDGLNPTGSGLKMSQVNGFDENYGSNQNFVPLSGRGSMLETQSDNNGGGGGDSSCWGAGSNGWPDLSIYTPSSNFQ
ncbi:hypothetical protein Dsin_014128 [Dipteronia sinensis]|uniref:Dof zinc finger protein n=1 Tax=Dipteronia sinensis TaxID=43782 RepID=A0AAE0ALR1_9ROSI|nr:hypothetical protein Dsin_014128 [Dipteronia sinensis]